ncbi:MAG: response regulator [Okeania sp. SIO3H1]|uniref:response regulator n=1 Tax=Okeania sp. SIO1I7 TaxID=2607772 RepID=UPI0013CCDF9C|nr:adenylate/guanylate cyclase domain-containing protein [Okeania sp. SIO1I7]NEN89360.1 response regulator [Okeania sp. SIO3H1]NET30277.1 response regulator [Okeania sp. SIO1I7]
MNELTILLVDDEPMVLESLSEELQRNFGQNYDIEAAESGEEALEILEELQAEGIEVAVVISDQLMPGIKGDELLSKIHLQYPDILKIMLTGQAGVESVGNAVNSANLYRYITKPWDTTDLNLTIKEALSKYLRVKQLERQNAQLLENERRLTQFLEAMPIGVSVHDVTGQMTYANQKAKELLNLDVLPDSKIEQLSDIFKVYRAETKQLYPTKELPIVRSLAGETVHSEDIEIHYPDRIVPIEISTTPIRDETGQISHAIAAFQDISGRKQAEDEREQYTRELFKLNEALSRFVPRQFLQSLAHKSITDIQLGECVQKQMSVLFADIRAFTTRSEQMTPEDTFKFINSYLRRMEPAIIENAGFIDKYIGDEIMALFEESADSAVNAAVTMLKILAEYNLTRQRPDRQPIEIGIGINTGMLMLGTVGGNSRIDTTAIGDTVNLGSRLQQLTKVYNTPLLISHHTLACLEEPMKYAMRAIAQVQVRGKSRKVGVFEVFEAEPYEQKQAKLETKPIFEEAAIQYYQGAIESAKSLFHQCLQKNPDDYVVQTYLQHCN